MAKRKTLETPSKEVLDRIEEEFRSEQAILAGLGRGVAPIASVAAETAAELHADGVDQRAVRARNEADASRFRAAQEKGLLIAEIPTVDIDEAALVRDRLVFDKEEQTELRNSIASNGLRLPIEVFELEERPSGRRYGLLSGYRRLMAVRSLFHRTGKEKFASINAIIRPRAEADATLQSMVEENEVRTELSNFERGRIAVIAAKQGAFADTEAAVDKLFASASKGKRSKVRSFARIFEELGDMLSFPEKLSERRGLQLAAALKRGAQSRLREALSNASPTDEEAEWAFLEPILVESEREPTNNSRGGRPRRKPSGTSWMDKETIVTSSGVTIRRGADGTGHLLRLEGQDVDGDLMDRLMVEIKKLLEAP